MPVGKRYYRRYQEVDGNSATFQTRYPHHMMKPVVGMFKGKDGNNDGEKEGSMKRNIYLKYSGGRGTMGAVKVSVREMDNSGLTASDIAGKLRTRTGSQSQRCNQGIPCACKVCLLD